MNKTESDSSAVQRPADEDRVGPPSVRYRLAKRILVVHGGVGDPWRDHWNLTENDSLLHKDALAEIDALYALLRSTSAASGSSPERAVK